MPARALPGRLLLCLYIYQPTTMPISNNTQPMLLQCAICPKRLSCPWGEFSANVRNKYCPVLAIAQTMQAKATQAGDRQELQDFINVRLN